MEKKLKPPPGLTVSDILGLVGGALGIAVVVFILVVYIRWRDRRYWRLRVREWNYDPLISYCSTSSIRDRARRASSGRRQEEPSLEHDNIPPSPEMPDHSEIALFQSLDEGVLVRGNSGDHPGPRPIAKTTISSEIVALS